MGTSWNNWTSCASWLLREQLAFVDRTMEALSSAFHDTLVSFNRIDLVHRRATVAFRPYRPELDDAVLIRIGATIHEAGHRLSGDRRGRCPHVRLWKIIGFLRPAGGQSTGADRQIRGHPAVRVGQESPAGVERFKPHTQCPVRLRRDAAALVGSYDTHRPADDGADRDTAFDTFTTVYDERAREIEAHRRIFPVRVVAVPIRCRAFRRPPCGWD